MSVIWFSSNETVIDWQTITKRYSIYYFMSLGLRSKFC